MMSPPITIRALEERDWPEVREIFDDIVGSAETFTYDVRGDDEEVPTLWLDNSGGQTVVAIAPDGAVLGTAKMGRNQKGPGSHVATASFMVARTARRQGVGRQLCEFAMTWAREQGFLAMQFNAVVSANAPAVQLWQSLGFAIVGTVPGGFRHPNQGLVDLYIMHRFLR